MVWVTPPLSRFLVAFGEEASEALLGAYTLEGVQLGVDPSGKQLIEVRGRI